jgi:hypothetical protein
MPSPPLHDLFVALAQAVDDFDKAATGEPGQKIKALGPAQGGLPDLIRQVLGAIETALQALRKAMVEGEPFLIAASAAVALFLLAERTLVALLDAAGKAGEGFGEMFQLEPLQSAGTALAPLKQVLEQANVIDGLLPLPEDLDLVQQALDKVLGPAQGPAGGSLRQILTTLTPGP